MTRYLELNDEHRIRNRIRDRRVELGATLTAVADAIAMNKGELSQIETGRRVPAPLELARLTDVLQADPEDLYPILEVPDLEDVVGRIGRPREELERELGATGFDNSTEACRHCPTPEMHPHRVGGVLSYEEPVAKPAAGPPRRRAKGETQNAVILELLRDRGAEGVTPMDALEVAGSMRLSGRILELRHDGHNIETQLVTTAGGARVARYVLHERETT